MLPIVLPTCRPIVPAVVLVKDLAELLARFAISSRESESMFNLDLEEASELTFSVSAVVSEEAAVLLSLSAALEAFSPVPPEGVSVVVAGFSPEEVP